MVLAIAWVPFIEKVSDSLWTYLQLVIAYTCPPAVSTFILGLFWRRANGTGSIVSLLTGFSLAVFMILSQVFEWIPEINELHFLAKASWLFVVCVVVHVTVSLMTAPQSAVQIEEYTYKSKMFKDAN